MKIIDFAGIKVDDYSLVEAAAKAEELLQDLTPDLIVTPNPEIIVAAQDDQELREIINSASLRVADGISMIVVSRILKKGLKERVSGIDLMIKILASCSKTGKKIFLLGSKPDVIGAAAKNLLSKYPGLNIVGTQHGFFEEDQTVIMAIKDAKPDILFVGLGAGRQEKWLSKHLKELNVPVSMVIGGSLDVISGNKKRAPKWIQALYIEWLYRLITEPKRWQRQLALPKFLYLTLIKKVL